MKQLKNLILILFLFITSNCAFGSIEGNFSSVNQHKEVVLSAVVNKNEVANFKEENLALKTIKSNQNLNISTRRQNQPNGSNNENICLLSKQKQNLLEYIYTKSYLDNKQKTALLPLLSQIQPHAP